MSTESTQNATNTQDSFKHQLAIKLSRELNSLNPNDLLAQTMLDMANRDSLDDFIKGMSFIQYALYRGQCRSHRCKDYYSL